MNRVTKEDLKSVVQATKDYIDEECQKKENSSNKTNEVSENSTNQQYPSAKAVYDYLSEVETTLHNEINTVSGNLDTVSGNIIKVEFVESI